LPTLTGSQVILRELRFSDAPALFAAMSTAETSGFISPPPATIAGFERFIAWTLCQRAAGLYICFAVVARGSDVAIGLFQFRSLEAGFGTSEWGFALASEYWGTGMFIDGAELALRFAFEVLGRTDSRRVRPYSTRVALERSGRSARHRKASCVDRSAKRRVSRSGLVVDHRGRLARVEGCLGLTPGSTSAAGGGQGRPGYHERRMDVREFDFTLPPELIAQDPAPERGGARLLVLDRASGLLRHTVIAAAAELLLPGDLVVVNNTGCFPRGCWATGCRAGARSSALLIARVQAGSGSDAAADSRTGASDSEENWEALTHPGQKLKPGARVVFDGPVVLHAEILERRPFGRRLVRLRTEDGTPIEHAVDLIGHVPLPPYIRRGMNARIASGIRRFLPRDGVRSRPRLQDCTSASHSSWLSANGNRNRRNYAARRVRNVFSRYASIGSRTTGSRVSGTDIDRTAAEAINRARDAGRRVIAVGHYHDPDARGVARAHDGRIVEGAGATDLFIYPASASR
jgi:S-adenosylmethionine:tRNA ribosyltransferase-isomerase